MYTSELRWVWRRRCEILKRVRPKSRNAIDDPRVSIRKRLENPNLGPRACRDEDWTHPKQSGSGTENRHISYSASNVNGSQNVQGSPITKEGIRFPPAKRLDYVGIDTTQQIVRSTAYSEAVPCDLRMTVLGPDRIAAT